MSRTKVWQLGLWSSVAALAALGIAVLTNNRSLGFGYSITRRHQLGLLAAAITLCVLQLVLYFLAHGKDDNNAKRNKRP